MSAVAIAAARCACGAPARVVVAGSYRVQTRECSGCAERRDADEQREEQQRQTERRLRHAGLASGRRASWSFRTVPVENAAAATRALAWSNAVLRHEPVGALLVYGAVGTGKTGLAHATLRHLLEHGQHGLLTTVRDLLADLRDSYTTPRPAVFERALGVGVVVLDDLGAERPTAWAVEQLARLVDHRYDRRLPVIATSNFTPDALVRRLALDDDPVSGQRIVSRLTHHATQLRLDGADRRRATATRSPA